MHAQTPRIIITGAAGLVGQNLLIRLEGLGYTRLAGIDKHRANTAILRRLHPDVEMIEADLAIAGRWETLLQPGDTLVIAHAQIGGTAAEPFEANNIVATRNLLAAAERAGVAHIVHISSSVVNSVARDHYTETKKAQEALVAGSAIRHVILRPTLMFGWFDRKHLGWLARLMRRSPIFPIPGDGKFRRQPLYAGDFCAIVADCIATGRSGEAHNISGLEVIDYIDLIRGVRVAARARTAILRIPFSVFDVLLRAYAMFDADPPFTTRQLAALALPELFEVIDWPAIFNVVPTPLAAALEQTFRVQPYCDIELRF
jgi:nucleoside-diphosphate-sugar epimerase